MLDFRRGDAYVGLSMVRCVGRGMGEWGIFNQFLILRYAYISNRLRTFSKVCCGGWPKGLLGLRLEALKLGPSRTKIHGYIELIWYLNFLFPGCGVSKVFHLIWQSWLKVINRVLIVWKLYLITEGVQFFWEVFSKLRQAVPLSLTLLSRAPKLGAFPASRDIV